MKTKKIKAMIIALLLMSPALGYGQSAPDLKTAADFGVLAYTAISFDGTQTVINDMDVGLYPGLLSSITGDYVVNNGAVMAADSPEPAPAILVQAKQDLLDAYLFAANALETDIISGSQGNLTLTPGVYKSESSLSIDDLPLTLDAEGDENAVWIFQIESTLTTTAGGDVILANGAKASNVYWQVGSSATIGDYTDFKGNILAHTSITINTGSHIEGRALAKNGAVTFASGGTVNEPIGAQLTVTKTADKTENVQVDDEIT